MRKFFAANIGTPGRVVRAVLGLSFVVAGVILSRPGQWYCTCLVGAGGFMLFEAARGWCVVRACGIRTML
jgi:hypothetical protein